MTAIDFLLYLVYGFSMISMGIFAIVRKESRLMYVPLVSAMNYLGYFGIIHGLSEWITLVIKLKLCHPHLMIEVYYTNLILKALSFTFLLHFGLKLLPIQENYKNIINKIPLISFLLYLIAFSWLIINNGINYHVTHTTFNTVAVRYFMAIPGCATAAAALIINARFIERTKSVKIARRYKNLAWIFIAYGFVEGLLVSKAAFFPANTIYKELFPEYFSLVTLSFKAVVGFIINYLLLKVIETFSWEQEERMSQLETMKIAAEERRKLGLEIHDRIIQDLYAIGLKIEYVSQNLESTSSRDILEETKENITTAINKTREFITVNAMDEIELDKLKDRLEQLIQNYNGSQNIKITLHCNISPYIDGYMLPETATQIYYIVQEAITNVIKHARAEHVEVLLEGRHDYIYITITDDGIGISQNINLEQHFGIRSMKERTQRIKGFLKIERLNQGTLIELKIPWEEKYNE